MTKPYQFGSLVLLVVAAMVGTGVFTTSGFTLMAVETPGRVMVCWAMAGIIAVCGAVAYGRLAGLIPESGGEYLYLSRHVHPLAGFLAGWTSLTAGFSGATAAAAVAFEQYAVPEQLAEYVPADSVAVAVIMVCSLLHCFHVRLGAWIQNAVVVIQLLAVTAFVFAAAVSFNTHQWHWISDSAEPLSWSSLIPRMAESIVWISLSYAGFNAAIYVAGESEAAERSVPKALLIGTVAVTLLYLVLNLIFVTAAPRDELAGQPAVAAIAAAAIGGRQLETLIRVAVSLGLLTSVMSMVMTGPRVYSQMANDGIFPPAFRTANAEYEGRGFRRSILLQSLIAIGLIGLQRVLVQISIITDSLLGLLIYVSTTLSLSSALCVATLFLPSVRRTPVTSRSMTADLAAAVFVLSSLLAILLMVWQHKVGGQPQGIWHLLGIAVTLASGLGAWWYFGRPSSPRTSHEEDQPTAESSSSSLSG
ncbi:MAG: APC family permease [Planctomycetaceae bacterium]